MTPIPIVVLHATSIALFSEIVWRESAEQIAADLGKKPDWPEGYCVEATIQLRDELDEQVPEAGGEFTWGTFTVGIPPGRLTPLGHSWIELGSGHLLDLTLGQFFRAGTAPILISPGGPLFDRYSAIENSPGWADPIELIDALGSPA